MKGRPESGNTHKLNEKKLQKEKSGSGRSASKKYSERNGQKIGSLARHSVIQEKEQDRTRRQGKKETRATTRLYLVAAMSA